ncbi:MAG: tetratricopeptide repeat protein [Acidobacteriaceae bacterium]
MNPHAAHWRRRLAMLLILGAAVALFTATQFASTAWINKRQQLAQQWVHAGDREAAESHPQQAVISYRNALLYNDDSAVRFRMSLAMIAAGDSSEAEAYLLSLLSEEPGNADYNLALAHLSQRQKSPSDDKAVSYYRAALLGHWESAPVQHRVATNLELARLLLAHRAFTDARAALLSLTAEMPKDTATQIEIAHLFLQAGDRHEAAIIAQQVLKQTPHNGDLRAFYASLLLHSGEFKRARQEFQLASEHTSLTPEMQSEYDIARSAETLDPYARGLRVMEQSVRLQSILRWLQQRLTMCAPTSPDLPQAQQWMQAASVRNLRDHPEAVDQIVKFAASVEQTVSACPLRAPEDAAIQLIGNQQ